MNTSLLTTNSKWIAEATKQLKIKGIRSARIDSLLLLEKVTGLTRIDLVSQTNIKLSNKQLRELNILLKRRLKDEPMAYIRGHVEFYGRDFIVDSNVLVPRPESEAFIDIVKSLELKAVKVADIGTGSGCLGITIKLEVPSLIVDLFDVSLDSLEVTKLNIKKFNLDLKWHKSSLLEKVASSYDIIIANLPYLPDFLKNRTNLSFEPSLALFAGNGGMELYKLFWDQINVLVNKPTYILCESLGRQHKQMSYLALRSGYETSCTVGLVQLFKLVLG